MHGRVIWLDKHEDGQTGSRQWREVYHDCFVEFRPGEPWKGYPNIDPETDPFVTPGSVINNLSINTVRDVDHLRDRNNGKQKRYMLKKLFCFQKLVFHIGLFAMS